MIFQWYASLPVGTLLSLSLYDIYTHTTYLHTHTYTHYTHIYIYIYIHHTHIYIPSTVYSIKIHHQKSLEIAASLLMLHLLILMVKSVSDQDVDDVEMFERRINAMQTIGIKKEDLAQAGQMSSLCLA